MKSKLFMFVGILMIASMVLAACQPAAQPETVTIIETVVVEKEGETVVEEREVVVTATPEPVEAATFASKDPETFVYTTFGDIDTWDPAFEWDSASAEGILNVYDTLVEFNGDDAASFVPQLAESWDISEDGLTYTFHIREGVSFHDGSALTPEDVAFTFQRGLLQGGLNSAQQLLTEPILGVGILDVTELVDAENPPYDDIETLATYDAETLQAACEVVTSKITYDNDAMTVTFQLEQPWGAFIATLPGGWGAVQSKAWLVAGGAWDGDCATWQNWYGWQSDALNALPIGSTAMGTGPYMFESWTPGEGYVLRANDSYWKTEPSFEGEPTGAPRIKTVVVELVDEFNTRLAKLQAGDSDFITLGSSENYPIMDQLVGEYCTGTNDPANCEPMPGNDPNLPLRRIDGLMSVNRTDVYFNFDASTDGGNNYIGSGQLDGNGIPADFFSDVHIRRAFNYCFDFDAYLNDVMQGEGVRSLGVMLPGMSGYPEEDTDMVYNYDLAKCEEEFKASTWVADDGTPLWDLGFRLTAAYNTGNDQRASISQIIQAGITAVNPAFVVEVTALPWPAYLAAIRARQLPIFTIGWNADFYDSHNWTGIFTSAYYGHNQNLPDDLMATYADINGRAAIEPDPEVRASIYRDEFNTLYYETAHGLTLYVPLGRRYEPRYLHGGEFNPIIRNYYYYWYKD